MDKAIYAKYKKAGSIAKQARNLGVSLIKPGISYLEVAEKIESTILQEGAEIAFPVNISVNDIAAHFSPRHDDSHVFSKGDLVKLDVGAHVDGYIADTATTIEIETTNHTELISAAADGLTRAIETMHAGVQLGKIGKIIEDSIIAHGFKPISNLTGHSLERYELHSGISVPNVANTFSGPTIDKDIVLAIEPFATNGAGSVKSGSGSNIYLHQGNLRAKFIRDPASRTNLQKIGSLFKTLPFAQRWCYKQIPRADQVIKKLSFLGAVKHYPQLIEKEHGMVTQKEHTVIVREDGCEVIT